MEAAVSKDSSPLKVLGWALYLGCSWTWCIGMFLPVLLIRDFGAASFLVFAVPNVLGAMLMGVALARPGASEQFMRDHRAACWWFSFITIAFQTFFFVWMYRGALPSSELWAVAGLLPLLLVRSHRSGWAAGVAAMVYILSLACALMWRSTAPPADALPPPLLPASDLLWLAPVCLFGFGLCPYLDATFHAARQRLPGRAGSAAFVLGFGVFFLSMILLTLAYAGPLLSRSLDARLPVQPGLLAAPLLLHVAAQLAFTAGLHRDCLTLARRRGAASLATAAAVFMGLGLGMLAERSARFAVDPETSYRLFMAFYALVFPAYVWICALGRGAPTRRTLTVYALAVAAASPMFWMASIERRTWWFAPGLLIVLAARLLVRPGPAGREQDRAPAPRGSA